MKLENIRKLPQIAKDSKDGISILGLWAEANENNDTVMIERTMQVMIENKVARNTEGQEAVDIRIERIRANREIKTESNADRSRRLNLQRNLFNS